MKTSTIIHDRLINQRIAMSPSKNSTEVVAWLAAMQAQEYAMAKWAIGLRLPGSTDTIIENAFNEGKILRTHVLRPTWHFVAPADIRWMLALTAPRVHALSAFMYRQLEMDNALFKRCHKILAKTLVGKNFLTRLELQVAFKQNKIIAEGQRLAYIMMQAELEALVCSGPRKGNQFSYALLEERVPTVKLIERQDALAQLSLKYFSSRGPATVYDFATWSGLTVTDARNGANTLPNNFVKETMNEQEYIFKPLEAHKLTPALSSYLMPDYDEYGMGYKERSALTGTVKKDPAKLATASRYNRYLVINGTIEGTWNRLLLKDGVEVETFPYGKLVSAKQALLAKIIKNYKNFLVGKK